MDRVLLYTSAGEKKFIFLKFKKVTKVGSNPTGIKVFNVTFEFILEKQQVSAIKSFLSKKIKLKIWPIRVKYFEKAFFFHPF